MNELTLSGTLDSLAAVRDWVRSAAKEAGLDSGAEYRLVLAVDEIATNVVVHGYEEAGLSGSLFMSGNIDNGRLCILLEDTGQTYDPAASGAPQSVALPIDERPIGGLGVFLAARGVDELRYGRVGNRNRHTFVVKTDGKRS